MKRMTEYVYFLIIIIGFMVAMIANSLLLKSTSAKIIPLFIAIFTIIEASIELKTVITNKEQKQKTREEGFLVQLIPITWIIAFVVLAYLVGFIFAIGLFSITILRWFGTKWIYSIVYSISITITIYVIFSLMEVDLYGGFLY